jgi:orotate phosphoribosyltransferase
MKATSHLGEKNMSRDEVLSAIRRMCYKEGKFTLASGKESDFYFDLKLILFNGGVMRGISSNIYQFIKGLNIEAIGGMELAAAPIAAAFTTNAHWWKLHYDGFVIRKVRKTHGTMRRIEGCDVRNKNVCIVDEVCTDGDTSMAATIAVQEAGGIVKAVIPIVCRNEGGRARFIASGYNYRPLFVIEDFR